MALETTHSQQDGSEFSANLAPPKILPVNDLYTTPWWLVILFLLWLYVIFQMVALPEYLALFFHPAPLDGHILMLFDGTTDYKDAFIFVRQGIPLTLELAFAAYLLSLIIGLLVGIVRSDPPQKPESRLPLRKHIRKMLHTALYHTLTIYVEFMRGIPPIVFLIIAGFIILPEIRGPLVDFLNAYLLPILRHFDPETRTITWRAASPATGVLGLSLIYGAFLSEVFRAGIQSVDKGQIEAAKSLGMTYLQTMRTVVVPQALRHALPPLGNNFISMIKDTSLVTVLGTDDVTQLGRRWTGSQFTYLETFGVIAMIYLTMTITGSMLVQVMERRLRRFARK